MIEATITLITQTNQRRIREGTRILWPDYEIIRHFSNQNHPSQIFQYCNMIKYKTIRLPFQE